MASLLAIFTDAASTKNERNPRRTAFGIICNQIPDYNYSAQMPDGSSPQLGELYAVIVALTQLSQETIDKYHIVVLSDELLIVRGLQLINHRQKNNKIVERSEQGGFGWDPKEVEFEKTYKSSLLEILQLGGECPRGVTIAYVPAHEGILGNELADIFAKASIYEGNFHWLMIDKENELRHRPLKEELPFLDAYFKIWPGTTPKWGKLERLPHYEDIVTPMDKKSLNSLKDFVIRTFGNLFVEEHSRNIRDLLKDLCENTWRHKKGEERWKLNPFDFLRMLTVPEDPTRRG